jgi:hypothetical protein
MTTAALMYDGINSLAAGIARAFPGAAKVAGYVNGRYAWSQAEWALFPHADHVTISVTASANAGDVLDVEQGDATPDQARGWIAMRKAAGLYRPTVYCSLSVVPAVRAATGSYILGRDYDIWVAKYDRSPSEPPAPGLPPARFAAKQYESDADWDISAVYDLEWPHRVPPGLPAPGGLSGTPHVTGNLSWAPVAGAAGGYQVQVAGGAPGAPGALVAQPVVAGNHAMGISLPAGPCCWRVRALPSGQWSAWRALERLSPL